MTSQQKLQFNNSSTAANSLTSSPKKFNSSSIVASPTTIPLIALKKHTMVSSQPPLTSQFNVSSPSNQLTTTPRTRGIKRFSIDASNANPMSLQIPAASPQPPPTQMTSSSNSYISNNNNNSGLNNLYYTRPKNNSINLLGSEQSMPSSFSRLSTEVFSSSKLNSIQLQQPASTLFDAASPQNAGSVNQLLLSQQERKPVHPSMVSSSSKRSIYEQSPASPVRSPLKQRRQPSSSQTQVMSHQHILEQNFFERTAIRQQEQQQQQQQQSQYMGTGSRLFFHKQQIQVQPSQTSQQQFHHHMHSFSMSSSSTQNSIRLKQAHPQQQQQSSDAPSTASNPADQNSKVSMKTYYFGANHSRNRTSQNGFMKTSYPSQSLTGAASPQGASSPTATTAWVPKYSKINMISQSQSFSTKTAVPASIVVTNEDRNIVGRKKPFEKSNHMNSSISLEFENAYDDATANTYTNTAAPVTQANSSNKNIIYSKSMVVAAAPTTKNGSLPEISSRIFINEPTSMTSTNSQENTGDSGNAQKQKSMKEGIMSLRAKSYSQIPMSVIKEQQQQSPKEQRKYQKISQQISKQFPITLAKFIERSFKVNTTIFRQGLLHFEGQEGPRISANEVEMFNLFQRILANQANAAERAAEAKTSVVLGRDTLEQRVETCINEILSLLRDLLKIKQSEEKTGNVFAKFFETTISHIAFVFFKTEAISKKIIIDVVFTRTACLAFSLTSQELLARLFHSNFSQFFTSEDFKVLIEFVILQDLIMLKTRVEQYLSRFYSNSLQKLADNIETTVSKMFDIQQEYLYAKRDPRRIAEMFTIDPPTFGVTQSNFANTVHHKMTAFQKRTNSRVKKSESQFQLNGQIDLFAADIKKNVQKYEIVSPFSSTIDPLLKANLVDMYNKLQPQF